MPASFPFNVIPLAVTSLLLPASALSYVYVQSDISLSTSSSAILPVIIISGFSPTIAAVPSYTFDTLDYFNSEYDGTLYFILGYDSIMTIDSWYRGKEILSLYPLITGRRPGTDDEAGREKISELRRLYNADITVLELEPYEAASSDIRKLASEGKPIDRYVSKGVKEYIEKHGLYR